MRKDVPSPSKRSSVSRSSEDYRIEFSNIAAKALKNISKNDRGLIIELLKAVQADPYDRALTCKLKGAWEGCRRARKGSWRIVYYPPRDNVIYIVYIRQRDEKTYKKS